jgi:hypothetical protein
MVAMMDFVHFFYSSSILFRPLIFRKCQIFIRRYLCSSCTTHCVLQILSCPSLHTFRRRQREECIFNEMEGQNTYHRLRVAKIVTRKAIGYTLFQSDFWDGREIAYGYDASI